MPLRAAHSAQFGEAPSLMEAPTWRRPVNRFGVARRAAGADSCMSKCGDPEPGSWWIQVPLCGGRWLANYPPGRSSVPKFGEAPPA